MTVSLLASTHLKDLNNCCFVWLCATIVVIHLHGCRLMQVERLTNASMMHSLGGMQVQPFQRKETVYCYVTNK